jgi:hypothetical protein
VLPSVQFDYDALLDANEIDDEESNRMLPSKFVSIQLPISQVSPNLTLCIGLSFSESAGKLGHHTTPLTPTLSPQAGRGRQSLAWS